MTELKNAIKNLSSNDLNKVNIAKKLIERILKEYNNLISILYEIDNEFVMNNLLSHLDDWKDSDFQDMLNKLETKLES